MTARRALPADTGHGWHIVLGTAVLMLLIASVAALWRLPRAMSGAAAPAATS